MHSMDKRRRAHWAITGWLLIGAAVPFASQAEPISPESSSSLREALRLEASNDFDRRLTVVGEATREVRRTGPAIAPSLLGVDEGALNEGSPLHNTQLQEQISDRASWNSRSGLGRNIDTGPDLLRETVNNALKATRDAFFDGGDTANFSLAGIDLSVTLRADRRGVSVNGYDILASNQNVAQDSDVLLQMNASAAEKTITGAPRETAFRKYGESDTIKLADIRKWVFDLVSEPITIVVILGFLGIWVVLAMASSRVQRD
jgi:hypothetical protein